MAKRGNPVQQSAGRKAISQSVVNPVASDENTSGGTPGALRERKQNPSKTLNQKVVNPSYGAAKAQKVRPGLTGMRGPK